MFTISTTTTTTTTTSSLLLLYSYLHHHTRPGQHEGQMPTQRERTPRLTVWLPCSPSLPEHPCTAPPAPLGVLGRGRLGTLPPTPSLILTGGNVNADNENILHSFHGVSRPRPRAQNSRAPPPPCPAAAVGWGGPGQPSTPHPPSPDASHPPRA